MRSDHRAQLAAAIARFQADIRRLARAVDPTRAHAVVAAMAGTRARATTATSRQPAAGTRQAGKRAQQTPTRRTRKPTAGARMPVEPTVMESALAPVASSAVTEVSTEPAMKGMA